MHVQDEHFRAYELPTYEILIHVPFYPVPEHCVFEFKVGLEKFSYQQIFRAVHWRYVADIVKKMTGKENGFITDFTFLMSTK